jgi:hypothetical protein
MKKIIFIIVIIVIIAGVGNAVWFLSKQKQPEPQNQPENTPPSSNDLVFDQSVSDGIIKISIPSSEFGLAVTNEQILVKSYIPPCDENFDYCLYYIGSAYEGTNFESAGIRVQKREDLDNQDSCLTTQPSGYSNLVPAMNLKDDYSISVFSPLGDAGAGHYATGSLYRLFYNDNCYEFETRTGQTQFANYPEGSIKEFTSADQSALESELQEVLDAISLPDGTKDLFSDGISAIKGMVMLGPMCPVMKNPPDEECADKPYAASLQLMAADGLNVIKEFGSDENGNFYIEVPPGEYVIKSAGETQLPYCSSQGNIDVQAGQTADAAVFCDTGIR